MFHVLFLSPNWIDGISFFTDSDKKRQWWFSSRIIYFKENSRKKEFLRFYWFKAIFSSSRSTKKERHHHSPISTLPKHTFLFVSCVNLYLNSLFSCLTLLFVSFSLVPPQSFLAHLFICLPLILTNQYCRWVSPSFAD